MKKALFTVAIAALIGAVPLASSYAEETSSTTTTTTAPTTTTVVVPTTTTAPVTTTTAPKPLTATEIRFLSVLKVNTMQYNHNDPKPAMEAFRIVASLRPKPWTPKEIKSWEIAMANIMMGESGFCPNVLRGAVLANPIGCVVKRQGKYQDAGFGQLIRIHYKVTRPGTGWLCQQEGLCSKWDIIASPWASMTALVALIERSGTQPWCFNKWARSYHRIACTNPGMDVG